MFKKQKYRKWFSNFTSCFKDKVGLEIGGPTRLFASDLFNIYALAERVDGCNFSANTIWEGDIVTGDYSYMPGKTGRQFILDGTDLSPIADSSYDFVLSSHSLEHIANPIKALLEWKRILKEGGLLLIILPDKRFTFDNNRPYTSFQHIHEDYQLQVTEADTTHISEIVQFHNYSRDHLGEKTEAAFKKRCENNLEKRAMHHHVFNLELVQEIGAFLEMEVISQKLIPPFHQVSVLKKQQS